MAEPPATLTVEAAGERLVDVRSFVRAFVTAAGADQQTVDDLIQAVDELACNVIEHGYRGAPGSIHVAADVVNGEIRVRLRDTAPPFDPRTVPTPRLDLPLNERPLGGMGIHLARTLTDRMDHRILPEGGNEVTVSKALRPVTSQERDDGDHDRPTEP